MCMKRNVVRGGNAVTATTGVYYFRGACVEVAAGVAVEVAIKVVVTQVTSTKDITVTTATIITAHVSAGM